LEIYLIRHRGTIRASLCGILKLPQEKMFYFGCPVENYSISIIRYNDTNFYIHTMNEIVSLPEK